MAMTSKQVLSIGQMKHLQELGLDTSDASMCWCLFFGDKKEKWELEIYKYVINQKRNPSFWEIIPSYTLQNILDKLPHYINLVPSEQILFAWMIERDTIAYRNVENVYECLKMFTNTCLIDAAYEILCWCIENGYIKELKNE